MDKEKTGKLEIHRESQLVAKLRSYSIFVDGEKAGSVRDGSTAMFSLAPGSHDVSVKIDWKKSNTITITAETAKTIKLNIAYKKPKRWKLLALSGCWLAIALIGGTLGSNVLLAIGMAGLLFSRIGKLHLYQETSNITTGSTGTRG